MHKQKVALIDCNNFYVSCERRFNPKIETEPVIVLSNNDGCVVSRSNEVKSYIPMGSPFFKIEHFVCPMKINVFSSNYELYGDMSKRVVKTIREFTDEVEINSIDECFLDLSGQRETVDFARQIKDSVKQITGIPTAIGIGETKTLAKVANKLAKKYSKTKGILDLTNHKNIDEILKIVDVGDVWGVGKKSSIKLNNYGIFTAYDLKYANDYLISKELTIVGSKIQKELNGIQCYDFEKVHSKRKEICCSRSFSSLVEDLEQLSEAITDYVWRACIRLRKQKSVAEEISVFLTTNTFKKDEPQYINSFRAKLPYATSDSIQIAKTAKETLKRIYRNGFRYRKVGITISKIRPESSKQLGLLFSNEKNLKAEKLMKVVDAINEKFRKNTLNVASNIALKKKWSMKRGKLSQRFTTNWNELLVVR